MGNAVLESIGISARYLVGNRVSKVRRERRAGGDGVHGGELESLAVACGGSAWRLLDRRSRGSRRLAAPLEALNPDRGGSQD